MIETTYARDLCPVIAPYDITYPYTVSVTTIKSVVSRFNIVFFIPENDYSNSFRIFLVLILIFIASLLQKKDGFLRFRSFRMICSLVTLDI